MNNDDLEAKLNQLGQALAPESSVVSTVLARVAGLPMEPARNRQLQTWIMRGAMAVAACVAVAILWSLLMPKQTAWAEVFGNVTQTKTVTFDVAESDGTTHAMIKGDKFRAEMETGITIGNTATGKWVCLDAKQKQATFVNMVRQPFDFYSWLKDFKDGKEENLGEKELNGRTVTVFKVTRPAPPGISNAGQDTLTVWVDMASRLPVQVEEQPVKAPGAAPEAAVLFKNLQFDVPLKDELFSMDVPADYKTQEMGGISADQLKPGPTTQEAQEQLTLKPAIGIGALKFGDTKEKVIAVLGPPEKQMADADLEYPSKGFGVLVDRKIGLALITAYSKLSAGLFVLNDFAGKTDKGIAMGATHAEIIAAYGEPTTVTPLEQGSTKMESLDYAAAHIQFVLFSGHLGQIIMIAPRGPASQPTP